MGDTRYDFTYEVWQVFDAAFPYISEGVLEWRFERADGETDIVALIYRVAGQAFEGTGDISRLVVLRVNEQATCLLGVVASNDEARALADDLSQQCEP